MPWGVDEDGVVVLSTSIELVFLDQVVRFKYLLVMLIDDGLSVLVDRSECCCRASTLAR